MPKETKPTIILVHGAWHVPAHYQNLVQQLEEAGYEVLCPLLPTCSDKQRASANLFTDAEEVRNLIVSLVDKSRNVVMLLHSYGGAVGTEAVKGLSAQERTAKGLPGGVTALTYMCGFMLQVGESVGGASLPRPDPEPVERDETGTTFLCQSPIQLFYADVETGKAREMESLLVRQSGLAMVGEITYPAWQHIPTTYLRTIHDQVLFLDWQDRQIDAVKEKGVDLKVETFESSHSPFLSMTDEMVRAVERAVITTTL